MTPLACIVVGGGPAGISTALFLSHGAPELTDRILVLEKERYPREKFCAGAVGARAEALLATIGVSLDVPSVAISGLAVRAMGETRIVREPGAGRVVRRIEFDDALARAARARGIEVRDGLAAKDVCVDRDGVTVRTDHGDFRAEAVVGADGVRGFVRRALGIGGTAHVAQAIEVDTEPVPSDLEREVLLFDLSHRDLAGYYWDFPTVVDGRALVCRGVYYLKSRRGPPIEIEDVLARELRARGLELSSYKKKRYAERGFDPAAVVARPRALLVGEASGIDAVTGEGIAQAIQYGALAGSYLSEKLRRGSFAFDDWPVRIRSSSVGRDLSTRLRALDLAYGPRRPSIERFLLDTPEFVQVGLQHFAGHPWSKSAALRALVGAVSATTRSLLGKGRLSSMGADGLR
jgi:flavin-dependent dehydrogenase